MNNEVKVSSGRQPMTMSQVKWADQDFGNSTSIHDGDYIATIYDLHKQLSDLRQRVRELERERDDAAGDHVWKGV